VKTDAQRADVLQRELEKAIKRHEACAEMYLETCHKLDAALIHGDAAESEVARLTAILDQMQALETLHESAIVYAWHQRRPGDRCPTYVRADELTALLTEKR
jgi:hypothetical protein